MFDLSNTKYSVTITDTWIPKPAATTAFNILRLQPVMVQTARVRNVAEVVPEWDMGYYTQGQYSASSCTLEEAHDLVFLAVVLTHSAHILANLTV